LNGDGKEDLIYSYECAEGLICIRIYLQINGEYVKQLDTARGPYTLETFSGDKKLQLTESCCGEGLFRLYQTYRFDQTSIRLVENYIVKSFAKDHGNPSVRGWVSGRYTEKE
ncbi:MAG: hypothetical protein LBL13_11205, partial [Bacteroidales bacterium]|nr:hypothetical protein [Bacteroidales bacterium]